MAFAHINLDAPSSPPGRNDPCPCNSGKKTKRCCTVDHWRFLPLRGRHRGGAPANLAERVDQLTTDFSVRFLARTFLPTRLAGVPPAALTDEERGDLRELFSEQREQLDQALEILEHVGYGQPRGRRPRADRAHGQVREQRLTGLVGKLPRSLAKRLPTSADTHRHGVNDGHDVYGQVSCSATLRAGHLGVLAAAGGLWHSRNPQANSYVECTGGELAHLITGRRRLGGKDIRDIHRVLAELEQLELTATVNSPKGGGEPNMALAIPTGPVKRVERRLPDGRWVGQTDYERELADLSDHQAVEAAQAIKAPELPQRTEPTIRIHLAEWFRHQIAQGEVARVEFRVWAHLRPLGQRAQLRGLAHREAREQIELVRKTLQAHAPRNENRRAIDSRAPLHVGAALRAGP